MIIYDNIAMTHTNIFFIAFGLPQGSVFGSASKAIQLSKGLGLLFNLKIIGPPLQEEMLHCDIVIRGLGQ